MVYDLGFFPMQRYLICIYKSYREKDVGDGEEAGSSNNTLFLLLMLFIAVLIGTLVAYNLQHKNSGATPPVAEWVADLIVAQDGSGNFTSISDAVAALTENTSKRFVIKIMPGEYTENIMIDKDKPNVTLIGSGVNITVLKSNRSVKTGWTTTTSATLDVRGHGFMAQNISVLNTAGPEGQQAVAVRIESDLSVFYKVDIIGYQDTLYAKFGRQFYRECNIYGTVDFIFGKATAVFQNCNLYGRTSPTNHTITFTAQGRESRNETNGFSIHNCTIAAIPEINVTNSKRVAVAYLGRPWKKFSRTVVMQSFLSDIISPQGWLDWNHSHYSTLNYVEFENRGPGADIRRRVAWSGFRVLDGADEARRYTVAEFIDGDQWLPAMNLPYFRGLI
ncbi:pectin methylesterase, family CE8 [Zostera marina]|uniref:Pectinesterase n=1 Tax=Zostera marina TaxID=29655 RepID=A0A0K9P2Z7_ZOSMR|nr:pectin methylesterase, family CE8 [Zostera marina]